MNKFEKAFIDFALNDDDFKNEYLSHKHTLNGFKEMIELVADYCFNDPYFNPYLDKAYVDYCYLKVGNKIINLDDIYEAFKAYVDREE